MKPLYHCDCREIGLNYSFEQSVSLVRCVGAGVRRICQTTSSFDEKLRYCFQIFYMSTSIQGKTSGLVGIALQWFGILGTAFTIFSNAQAFIDFSNFVRLLTDKWRELIAAVINFFLGYFNLALDIPYAVLFFCIVSCIIVAVSARPQTGSAWSMPFRLMGWLVAALFSAVYFIFVAIGATSIDPRMADETAQNFLFSFIASSLLAAPVYLIAAPTNSTLRQYIGWIGFVLALICALFIVVVTEHYDSFGSLPAIVEYLLALPISLVFIYMYYVSDPVEITKRTFSIGFIICLLYLLNVVSRFVESMGIS